jgi:hypothetical protein
MDLGGWLRRLGLEEHEAVFREIDLGTLTDLTDQDREKLGICFDIVAKSCGRSRLKQRARGRRYQSKPAHVMKTY